MHRILALFAALALPLVLATPAMAESRGLTVELRTEADVTAPIAERVELYDHSYALVIGNDAYDGGWPKLSNAVADATEIAAALKKAGFEVTLKTDLDSSALGASMKEFFVVQGADPEARLLLWYAGHGHSIKDEGFLVPIDAPAPAEPEFKIRALQMRDFGSWMRLAEAKHVLAIFDSCFSGTIFTTRAGAVPAAITQITTQPTRQFITSGDAAQQVSDDGNFRRLFLQALAGESTADSNRDGYLTGTELGLYMYDEMANYSEGAQTPRYGKLRDPDYDRGDFVFAVAGRTEAPLDDFGSDVRQNEPAASAEDMITEITLWTTVVGSQDPAMVQTYLDAYPTGRFAKAAIARIADLKKQIAASKTAEVASAAVQPSQDVGDFALSLDQRALEFLDSFMADWSRPNDEALARMPQYLAPELVYFGSKLSRAEVMAETAKLAKRWPVRDYRLVPDSADIACSASRCSATVRIDWSTYSPERAASGSGLSQNEFTLLWNGRDFQISFEDGKAVTTD